jgi:hypothetical protein
MTPRPLIANIECYMTDDAKRTLSKLEELGLHPDLAWTILEKLCPEEQLYELPLEDEGDAS